MSILDHVMQTTNAYISQMPKEQRKEYGQFFTSRETAVFMAGLLRIPEGQELLTVLDPGAGSGVLAAALVDRLQRCGVQRIHLVCYENDPNILPLLHENLEWMGKESFIPVSYQIMEQNYILSQAAAYQVGAQGQYDLVIGNPPYKKISKAAPEALAMPDICYGAPNLYFLFAEMSLFNLKANGEMVYIIPRSWTSGAYFRKFRQKFLTDGALEHIHLFDSRRKVFDQESVLQETIIIKVKKTAEKPDNIMVTSSGSNADFSDLTEFEVPYGTVVSGDAFYVYLVTSPEEVRALDSLNHWTDTLPKLGLKMKTGLTVDFRNKEALRNEAEDRTVPLFYAQHIRDGKVSFPVGKEHEYILTDQKGLLQPNSNYLFVKRFTTKEEHRRLQCGIYLARRHPEYSEISTQNKINFIGGLKNLSDCVVYGLYVLFNSTLYDSYYRILNGSTQVNATEVNAMPVPPLGIIEAMGKRLIQSRDLSVKMCDEILGSFV